MPALSTGTPARMLLLLLLLPAAPAGAGCE